MNKLVKGTIAAGAGVALLLGGGSTLAYWTANTTAFKSTISSGELKIVANTDPAKAPVWSVQNTTAGIVEHTISGPANYKIVPGDDLTYTATYDIKTLGDNLGFKLYPSVTTASNGGSSPVDPAFSTLLLNNMKTKVTSIEGADVATRIDSTELGTSTVHFPADGKQGERTYTVTVKTTLSWPIGDDLSTLTDNEMMKASAILDGFSMSAVQVNGQ